MNIELARTFLEVLRLQSFSQAAQSLHLTQTAVTTRIQNLEKQMQCRLFERNRGGIALTAQGECFVPYARQMLQLWERACQEVPMTTQMQSRLRIGGELSLWNPLLLEWLIWLRLNLPDTSVRANVELAESLVNKVLQNLLDIAVIYSPQYHPQLKVEMLMEETLIMVTTHAEPEATGEYITIDWGPEFLSHHDQTFPELMHSSLSIGLGPLALHYILKAGGSGYFRSRAVQPYLQSGQLVKVPDAPVFHYPVYVTTMRENHDAVIEQALAGLRTVMEKKDVPWVV
jgi:LysR family transcriptional regulator, flagellar master operon regulator